MSAFSYLGAAGGPIVTPPLAQSLTPVDVNGFVLAYVSATQVVLGPGEARDFTDTFDIVSTTILTADITVAGANGLDTGIEAASTWYFIHVIGGRGVPTATLLSTSMAAPTLPAGYTAFQRIGQVRNDAGSNFVPFLCTGNRNHRTYSYSQNARAVVQALAAGAANAFTALSLAGLIPPPAVRAYLEVQFEGAAPNDYLELRPTGSSLVNGTGTRASIASVAGQAVANHLWIETDSNQNVDYRNSALAGVTDIYVRMYTDIIGGDLLNPLTIGTIKVLGWFDESLINGNTWVPTTIGGAFVIPTVVSTNAPTLTNSGGPNGGKFVRFTKGANEHMVFTGPLGGEFDRIQIFSWVRYYVAPAAFDASLRALSPAGHSAQMGADNAGNNYRCRYQTSTNPGDNNDSVAAMDTGWHWQENTLDGTNSALVLDSAAPVFTADVGTMDMRGAGSNLIIGASSGAGANSASMDLAGTVFLSAAFTPSETAALRLWKNHVG